MSSAPDMVTFCFLFNLTSIVGPFSEGLMVSWIVRRRRPERAGAIPAAIGLGERTANRGVVLEIGLGFVPCPPTSAGPLLPDYAFFTILSYLIRSGFAFSSFLYSRSNQS